MSTGQKKIKTPEENKEKSTQIAIVNIRKGVVKKGKAEKKKQYVCKFDLQKVLTAKRNDPTTVPNAVCNQFKAGLSPRSCDTCNRKCDGVL